MECHWIRQDMVGMGGLGRRFSLHNFPCMAPDAGIINNDSVHVKCAFVYDGVTFSFTQ